MGDRKRSTLILGTCTAVGYFVTAALHGSAYFEVAAASRQASGDVGRLLPLLWVAFSADLIVVGAIALVAVRRRSALSSLVLCIAGFMPAIAAGLQIVFLGFIPPTAILLVLAAATWASAVALRPDPEDRG